MKKNGFIATSILYSFFLVFVTLFVALITAYLHNRILLSKMNEAAWDTLMGINNTKISDLSVGQYIRFDTSKTESILNPDAKWIVAYIETNGNNKTYYFLSDITAQKPFMKFQTSYDTIPKMHPLTPIIYQELLTTTMYPDSFYYPGFKIYVPTTSLLSKIRSQDLNIDIMDSIFDAQESYLITADQSIPGYQINQLYEYKTYNFALGSQQKDIIKNYCGGDFDGDKVVYNGDNTFGYINVVKDSVKNEKYVNYCSYASAVPYTHPISDNVVGFDENKPTGDLIENLQSSSYRYRLVAEITVDVNANDTYIAGGKGIFMDPYLFTNGGKQS